jgi:hypothetical protein
MRKAVFLYSEDDDPLVREARPAARRHKNIYFISFAALSRYFEECPWPKFISATYPSEITELFKGGFIVNRVFGISSQSLSALSVKADALAHFAIEPLIKSGIGAAHDLGPPGVSRTQLPLTSQWEIMSNYKNNGIPVPKFLYVLPGEAPDLNQFHCPMQKSVWSIFDWKEERHLSEVEKFHYRFFVEKPIGFPIVCHFLGDVAVWFSFPTGRDPNGRDPKINAHAFEPFVKQATVGFKSSIGEFLTFLEPNGVIRFYAFSPILEVASETTEFSSMVKLWINSLVQSQ